MIYRQFGNNGLKVSQLGFGAMRFPLLDERDFSTINEPLATEMLHYAIDKGVNYLDNAYGYHRGKSEGFVGRALTVGARNRTLFATKLPMWLVKGKEDAAKYFSEQCQRLQTDIIHMYLLHALSRRSWKTAAEFDVLMFLDRLKAEGRIRYAGFSFHDELPLFKEIVDAYHWNFCQIHLNYVDTTYQAGIEGLEYARAKGMDVVIMEPLRGGKLCRRVPEEIKAIIRRTGREQTPAEFALRFLYNRSDISCVLSGMSSLEQVAENVRFASNEHRGSISPEEAAGYAEARRFYISRVKVNCTSCQYCLPCPQKIGIPFMFELYNDVFMYSALEESKALYPIFFTPESQADKCTQCGECEDKCPQKIPIIDALKDVHRLLTAAGTDHVDP